MNPGTGVIPPGPAPPPMFRFKVARAPMLWAAIAYSSGIVSGVYQWRPVLWWVVAVAAFVAAAIYFARRRSTLGWALALGALFLAGALHIQVRTASPRLDTSINRYADHQKIEIIAHVTRDGRLQQGGFNEIKQTVDVETESIETTTGREVIHSGIRLSIYSRNSKDGSANDGDPNDVPEKESNGPHSANNPVLHFGDRIRVSTVLRLPRNFRNPGAFDYQQYLADRGIAALGSAKLENVKRVPGFSGSRIGAWRSRLHRGVVARIHELWLPRDAALIDAMVIGEEAFIDRDTRVDFQRSGTYHVLVVSGMNVSILAFVVFWTLRRLRVADIPATLLTIAFCVAYAFTTEVGAPVWRATLMCAIYLSTRLLYRDRAMVNALGAAGLGLLVFDPRQLFTASFQMTFLCVLIVAAIAIPILQRSSQLYKQALANWDSNDYAALLPPRVAQFRVELQFIAARVRRFVGEEWSRSLVRGTAALFLAAWELLFVSAVMQIGLALPMAYYFHRATTVGLPSNLVAVPLTQLMMPAASAGTGSQLHLALAGQIAHFFYEARPARHHRNRARTRCAARWRLARSHSFSHHHHAGGCCACIGDVGRLPQKIVRTSWTCGHSCRVPGPRIHASDATSASRSPGSHFHRCRRRRLNSARYAARPHAARRCRRSHWSRRFATRLR